MHTVSQLSPADPLDQAKPPAHKLGTAKESSSCCCKADAGAPTPVIPTASAGAASNRSATRSSAGPAGRTVDCRRSAPGDRRAAGAGVGTLSSASCTRRGEHAGISTGVHGEDGRARGCARKRSSSSMRAERCPVRLRTKWCGLSEVRLKTCLPPLFHGGVGSACGAAASNWTGELRTCSLMHPVERACEIGSGVGSANKDGGLRERKRTRKADAEYLNRSAKNSRRQETRPSFCTRRCLLVDRRPCCPTVCPQSHNGKAHPSSRALWIYVPYLPGTLMGSRRECVRSR